MEIWMLRVAIGIVLIAIGIQDLRLRAVSWYLFPILMVLLRMEAQVPAAPDVLVNIGFVLLVFLLLSCWYSLKLGRPANIFDRYIGFGDLLFLLCLAGYFRPAAFFIFYMFSLLFIALGTGIYLLYQSNSLKKGAPEKKEEFTVPLAGLQGLVLLLVMLVEWAIGGLSALVILNLFQDPV